MKTLQELYKEVIASEDLKKEFTEASKDEKNAQKNLEEFLKKNGCDATFEELKAFLADKSDGERSEDEVEEVAGGRYKSPYRSPITSYGMAVGSC